MIHAAHCCLSATVGARLLNHVLTRVSHRRRHSHRRCIQDRAIQDRATVGVGQDSRRIEPREGCLACNINIKSRPPLDVYLDEFCFVSAMLTTIGGDADPMATTTRCDETIFYSFSAFASCFLRLALALQHMGGGTRTRPYWSLSPSLC